MIVFQNNDNEGDAPYLQWLADHPAGFVLNSYRKPKPEYMMLHTAACHSIREAKRSKKASPFTAEGFIKVCSENPLDLFQFSSTHGRVEVPHFSNCCKRFWDSSSFGWEKTHSPLVRPLPKPSLGELLKLAKAEGSPEPKRMPVESQSFVRSKAVTEYAKAAADGSCSLCENRSDLDSLQFLDCHHIVFLRDGGSDMPGNVVGVCPNCHRRLHMSPDPAIVEKLTSLARKRADEGDRL